MAIAEDELKLMLQLISKIRGYITKLAPSSLRMDVVTSKALMDYQAAIREFANRLEAAVMKCISGAEILSQYREAFQPGGSLHSMMDDLAMAKLRCKKIDTTGS